MSRYRLLALLLSLPLLILVGPVAASAATVSSLDIIDPASSVAKVSAVEVELTGTCPVGETSFFFAEVTQAVGGRIAKGSGLASGPCPGQLQQVTVLVVAAVRSAPFH